MPAVSEKGGVDDGNQKMGTLASRHERVVGIVACFDFKFLIML
jgi:hypothetical protein